MDDILNQVQVSWSKDLIIRFLYIKLAPYFKRDIFYFLASKEEQNQQYMKGFINRFPYVVCSTLADFYVDLFLSFGINAKKIIATSSLIPLFAVIVEGDFGWYFLAPLNDLMENQYGLKPYFFGIIPRFETTRKNYPELVQLEKEYVNELDDELKIKFIDQYFKDLESLMKKRHQAKEFFGFDKNADVDLKERKYEFINENFINIGKVDGIIERAQMYKFLSERILNRTERNFTKTKIVGDFYNSHILIELKVKGEIITFEEEKQDNKYLLKKISS